MIDIFLYSNKNNLISQTFLVDTGFTGNLIFFTGNREILKNLFFHNLIELEKNKWVEVADGRDVKTFSGEIMIKLGSESNRTDVLIMDSNQETYPIIGIDFLKQDYKRLILDFKENFFEIA